MAGAIALADALLDALPQTQCTRCGYADCRGYALAMAGEGSAINRCPPGGAEGVVRLARLTGRQELALDASCGTESLRLLALVDEAACIGCALCLKACPVDAILGAAKQTHTVIDELCTGCELCVPACPVDCISLVSAGSNSTGWAAWSKAQAQTARQRHAERLARIEPAATDVHESSVGPAGAMRRNAVATALARARVERSTR